jgi:hypothetical protein
MSPAAFGYVDRSGGGGAVLPGDLRFGSPVTVCHHTRTHTHKHTHTYSQIKSSLKMLKGHKKAVPFRFLRLPDPINWLEPQLMKGKAFEDAELRANAAGTCGLSALTCVETSRAHASIIHTMCKNLPPMANASQKELKALNAWRDDIRHEVADWVYHIKTRSDVGPNSPQPSSTRRRRSSANRWLRPPNGHLPAQQLPLSDTSVHRQRQDHQGHGGRCQAPAFRSQVLLQ